MHDITKPLTIYFKPKQTGTHSFIYCRIKLNGLIATDFSTRISHCELWDQKSQLFNSFEKLAENQHLFNISEDLRILLRELQQSGKPVCAQQLRNLYLKRMEKRTLMQCYTHHLKQFKDQLGTEGFSKGTLKVHNTLHKVMEAFLASGRAKDIDIRQINKNFGLSFIRYMRVEMKYAQNYIVKNINHLKRILEEARADDYLGDNPLEFVHEKIKEPGPIGFLTEKEVELLKSSDLLSADLRRICDAFLFQCYTGLCYSDLKRFSPVKHIVRLHGVNVIQYQREKTSTLFTIPILPYAKLLIERYGEYIPVISNTHMNRTLKVIARAVGIEKHLTTHIGRKTAGTYLLNNGVPMEVVSKILGHKSIRTTEKIYAHLLQETIIQKTAHLIAA